MESSNIEEEAQQTSAADEGGEQSENVATASVSGSREGTNVDEARENTDLTVEQTEVQNDSDAPAETEQQQQQQVPAENAGDQNSAGTESAEGANDDVLQPTDTAAEQDGEGSGEGAAKPVADGDSEPVVDSEGQPVPNLDENAQDAPADGAVVGEEGAETERSEHQPGGEEGEAAEGGAEGGMEGGAEGGAEGGMEGGVEGGAEGGTEDQPPTDRATAAERPTELPGDTFEMDETAEVPLVIGERLSREGSLTERDPYDFSSPPVPGTPQMEEEEEEEEEEMDEYAMEAIDRERLTERYQQAIQEQNELRERNMQLQTKLSEHFRKKRAEDGRPEVDKATAEQENRYIRFMANLDDLRRRDSKERELFQQQLEELRERCDNRQQLVEQETQRFQEVKKQVALSSVNTRSGRTLQMKDIEIYLNNDAKKEVEVVQVCIENIKLKNKLKKKEQQLKSKEELAEGLHMIDFEQLKIENQTYNEKIEERNEDLLKLRKKITGTVQMLTHVKEKLQFVQAENQLLKEQLSEVDSAVAKKRDALSRTKQARDTLRNDNQKLKQSCGLLGNNALLRDFEEREDESTELSVRCQQLKQEHAELSLMLNRVRRKLDQAHAVSR